MCSGRLIAPTFKLSWHIRNRSSSASMKPQTILDSLKFSKSPAARLRKLSLLRSQISSQTFYPVWESFGSWVKTMLAPNAWRACWPRSATRLTRDAVARLIKKICLAETSRNACETSMRVLNVAANGRKSAQRFRSASFFDLVSKTGKKTTEYSLRMRPSSKDAETLRKFVRANFSLLREALAARCLCLVALRVKSGNYHSKACRRCLTHTLKESRSSTTTSWM